MLAREEVARPTAREALQHVWFKIKSQQTSAELSSEQMIALCEFGRKNEFQKAIMLQAASQIRAADLSNINTIFRTYDRDNTGYLDRNELIDALKALGIDDQTAKKAAENIDLDNNDKIEYTEFV